MAKAKYIPDKLILQYLNKEAIKHDYNQVIEPTAFDRIPEARYPITFTMLEHDGEVVRCRVVLNEHGGTVLLDIDVAKFNALPEYDTETGQVSGSALDFIQYISK